MQKRTIAEPPADIELGLPREPLEYYVVTPENGISEDTGLIFWVVGWGMEPNGEYSIDKLMPYLANKYDCLVVSIKYHGQPLKGENAGADLRVSNNWPKAIHERFGIDIQGGLTDIFQKLNAQGVQKLDDEFSVYADYGGNYQSFGFLPALDHIAVLGDVMKNFTVNRRRIMALGSSYGGYIVSLLLKFMPHTFSLAIDNSGFSKATREELSFEESGFRQIIVSPEGLRLRAIVISPWRIRDERHPGFFRPAYAMIRDLTLIDHMQPSETELYLFHSRKDHLSSFTDKEMYAKSRSQFAPTHFMEVTQDDVDGRTFKNLDHGLQASMRGLFDLVAERAGNLEREDELTDFDRETHFDFPCRDRVYHFSYTKDLSFTCSLTKIEW